MMKILISDYDETFYINDQDVISNVEAVNRFKNSGNIFIIATGRSYDDFMDHIKKHKFSYDYLILNHGATIVNSDNEMIYNNNIDEGIIGDIINDLNLEDSKSYFCCDGLNSRVAVTSKKISKINVLYNSIEKTIEINKKISNKYANYISTYINRRYSLEIVSKDINKLSAIKYLLEKFKLSDSEIYVIGDGYSDIKMIKEFNGFAIKDSIDEVKKCAIKEYNSVSDLVEDILCE